MVKVYARSVAKSAVSRTDTVVSAGRSEAGLQAEEMGCVLEGGERTLGLGKGGLQMGDDLGFGAFRRQLRWWASLQQHGADATLGKLKAFPEPLPGAVASFVLGHGTSCRRDAIGEGLSQEAPYHGGTEAESTDFVGQPDADGSSATITRMPVAAVNPPCPLTPALAFVVPQKCSMPIQPTDLVAMGTRRHLQPFHQRGPF